MAQPSVPSDADLMAALARRDLDALAALYDRHGRLAYTLAYRILGEPEAAQDVVHDAYIAAWKGASGYRHERGSVRGWLMSIVHHRSIDLLRRKTAFRPAPLEEAVGRASEEDTAAQAEQNVTNAGMRRALEELPPAQRKTIELAYFGGYTHAEMAQLMGVPLGTVKGRMRIGLQKLRRALEDGSARLSRGDAR
ncbi:MAG: sigma-70 family RNA polymerase sigma factor [Chloroflexota bacterium]|nr:sigma-70 family RNA polymerase sigma factor [Chloroflexota bacterium]